MSKKSRFAILTFVLLFAIGMCCVACNNSSTKKSYKVSFDTDGGTEVAEIVCNEGDKLSLPTDPAKAHYTFDGWYTNAERTADSKFDAEKAISSDMTLYAKWQAVKYTVTFKADGKQVGEALTYTIENKQITDPSVPEKDGFIGEWEEYELNCENIVVNAVYTAVYTVTFKADGEQVGEVLTYTMKNKQITEPAVPEKVGYNGAWEEYELNCENIVVNAVYTVIPYTVTFKSDGKQVGEVLTYTVENKQITEPAVPVKVGYNGAWEEYELNCENIVVNAVYTVIPYTVTFKSDGKQVGEVLTYTVENKQITEPAVPAKVGYNGAWEEYELNCENIVVNAVYTAKTDIAYTVEHYQQNIADDDYSLVAADTQNLTGTTDTDTNATAKNYTGFTALQIKQAKIAGDGSTVIKVYYDRLTYTVIWKGVSGEVVETDENVRYGATPSYDGGKLYKDDSPTRVKSQKWNPTPVEVSADAEYTVEIVSELAFFAKDSTKMTIEEITEGDFAGSIKVQSTADDWGNRLLFYGVNDKDGTVKDGLLGWWERTKYVTFDLYYSGQSINLNVSFASEGASYDTNFSNGAVDNLWGRIQLYTKKGYAVQKMQTTAISSSDSVGNWYTLSFCLQGTDVNSTLAGLTIWGGASSAPLYVKNLRVLDSFPTAKTAVNPLGFSTTDKTITLTADNKDGVDCIKATTTGTGNIWFEDVMTGSTHGDFFLLDYNYIKFDIFYESGDGFAFCTKYDSCGHNGQGTWMESGKDGYSRVYDSDKNRVTPGTGKWYTVYYSVAHATAHASTVQFAFWQSVPCTVYLANLQFATAFPDA